MISDLLDSNNFPIAIAPSSPISFLSINYIYLQRFILVMDLLFSSELAISITPLFSIPASPINYAKC